MLLRDLPAIDRPTAERAKTAGTRERLRGAAARKVAPVLSLSIFAVAILFLSRQIAELDLAVVLQRLGETTGASLLAALLLTSGSFLVLSAYDLLGLRQIGVRLPYRTVLSTSFQSYAFTNAIGFALITGGSVRYRHYREAGLSALQIASVQILCVLAYTIGAATIVGTALVLDPPAVLGVAGPVAAMIGVGLLLAVTLYVGSCAIFRTPLRIGRWSGRLPPPELAFRQIAVVVIDLSIAGTIPFVLLPAGADVPYLTFLGAYFLAITIGVASNVPGGLGVFESAMVLLLPSVPGSDLIASLLAFRVVYFLLPAVAAALLLITQEWMRQRRR